MYFVGTWAIFAGEEWYISGVTQWILNGPGPILIGQSLTLKIKKICKIGKKFNYIAAVWENQRLYSCFPKKGMIEEKGFNNVCTHL